MVREFDDLFDSVHLDWYLREVRGIGGLAGPEPEIDSDGEKTYSVANPKVLDILFVGLQKDWKDDFGDDTDGERCTNTDE